MEITEATLQELRDALPYMTEEEVAEALILLEGQRLDVAIEQPILTPAEFRQGLRIVANNEIRLFPSVAEPWQVRDMEMMDPAWMAAIGAAPVPPIRRAWFERPKSHSKTDDTAGFLCWALTCAVNKISAVVGAEDFDQADLMRQHIETLIEMNSFPLKVSRGTVTNMKTGSTCETLTSDAPSTHGISPDIVIADELCHWRSSAMWDTLLASHDKKPWSLFVVLTNAGWQDSWAWETREGIRQDTEGWYFSRLEGPTASWVTEKQLSNQRKHLRGPMEFERLWLNEWISGSGTGISSLLIDAAIDHDLSALSRVEPGMVCSAGIDIGVTRDHSALYVTGMWPRGPRLEVSDGDPEKVLPAGTIRLCYGRKWKPKGGTHVDLEDVERETERVAKAFKCAVTYDPEQMEAIAQRLIKRGVRMVRQPQTTSTLQKMATALLEGINDQRLNLYHDADLIKDLRACSIVTRARGFRIESPRNADGHGDALTALQLSLLGLTAGKVRASTAKDRLAAFLGIPAEGVGDNKAQTAQNPSRS